ncbi:MAG: hypothetical protein M3290_03725 [Actinomycetota bacterium]|nr:hypothetical protein [Actinomycetota bacterium]
MTSRALAIGSVVAALYVATSLWAGHRDPNAARPLLDGLTAPASYHWVDPPPDLVSSNKQPSPLTTIITTKKGQMPAGAFSTPDAQLSIVTQPNSLQLPDGTTSVQLTLTPLAPAAVQADPPSGLEVTGNVYRIQAIAKPPDEPLAAFDPPARVILVYPASSTGTHVEHTLLLSRTGQTWTKIATTDSAAQQQASGLLYGTGYLVAAAPAHTGGSRTRIITIAIVAVAVAILAALLLADVRRVRRLRAQS